MATQSSGDPGVVDLGRSTVGTLASTVRSKLRVVVVAFLVGLLGTTYAMRLVVWDLLRDVTTRRLGPATIDQLDIVVRTPFDVILLQVKLGTGVGAALALAVVVWSAREPLRATGLWPTTPRGRRVAAGIATLSALLFAGGVAYAYYAFFPFMFEFLTEYTVATGFVPTYDIVAWTEFVLLLTISFGLAAQLPLAMSGLAYAEIVAYETFRDRWRYAVVAIFVFGAFFSPPDPFTQFMWAVPLLALYAASLALTRVVVAVRRYGSRFDPLALVARYRRDFLVVPTVAFAIVAGAVAVRLPGRLLALAGVAPPALPVPLPRPVAAAAAGAVAALVVAGVVLAVHANREIGRLAAADGRRRALVASVDVDRLDELDAGTVRSLPVETFGPLTGRSMLASARRAIRSGDRDLAAAIVERHREAREAGVLERARRSTTDGGTAVGGDRDLGASAEAATAHLASALRDDPTTPDEVGGYYDDLAFVVASLRSKSFRVVGVFAVAMVATFVALFQGGVDLLQRDFLSRIPPAAVPPDEIRIVALHPTEVLLFVVEASVVVGLVAALPAICYYAWPVLKERGLARGDERAFLAVGAWLATGFVGGSLLGYLFVAPTVISYLAFDAVQAGAVVSYRIDAFFWLVFMTTAFVGVLAVVPVSMWLFHRAGIVRLETMRAGWRVAVVGVFVLSAVLTDSSVVSMLAVGVPLSAAYLLGVGVVWLVTVPERFGRGRPGQTGDDETNARG